MTGAKGTNIHVLENNSVTIDSVTLHGLLIEIKLSKGPRE